LEEFQLSQIENKNKTISSEKRLVEQQHKFTSVQIKKYQWILFASPNNMQKHTATYHQDQNQLASSLKKGNTFVSVQVCYDIETKNRRGKKNSSAPV